MDCAHMQVLTWTKDFLFGRKQSVVLEGNNSDTKEVLSGEDKPQYVAAEGLTAALLCKYCITSFICHIVLITAQKPPQGSITYRKKQKFTKKGIIKLMAANQLFETF